MKLSHALFLSFLALPLAAQQQPPVAASVEVKVINVDVTVTDRAGHAVPDLTKDDFEVLEDGQPQTIKNFYGVDRKSVQPVAASPLPRQLQRKTFVLIDNNYLEKRDRDIALDRLRTFIDETSEADAQWSIGAIATSLEVLQPFTSDHKLINAALDRARTLAVSSLKATDADRDILTDPFRRGEALEQSAQFEGRERTTRSARSLAYLSQALAEAARAEVMTEGRKTILLITGAIEMNTSFAAFDRSSDREMRDMKTTIARQIDTVIQEANTANVTVFILNAGHRGVNALGHDIAQGPYAGASDLMTANASDLSDADSAGMRIATGTGGLYMTSGDIRASLGTANENAAHYYSIGFSPSHSEDRKYHRIAVKVKKPNLNVAYRQGYLDLSPEERLESLLRLRVSTIQPAQDVPVTAEVKGDQQQPLITITAATPFKNVTLLPAAAGYAGRVNIYVSVFDRSGRNVGFHHMTQDIVIPKQHYDQAMADIFRYRFSMKLDKGDFIVAVTLRDELSRQIGTAVQNVKL